MANKISVVLDFVTDKAVGSVKGFKKSIDDADGAIGKMKAGATGAFDSIKANAGNMAMVAGAAIVGFGVKAVTAFQDTALEAGRFSEISGLAVEDASRWIAVADDIGVSSGTMETAFGKLNVEIGKGGAALKQFGIDVITAKDGTVDANATFLNAIETIKGIQDPTKKAQAAQAAFGKGWKEMAELINMGSEDIVTAMGEVSDAQIIDQEELEKARDFREKMDELQDAVRDVALVVGEDLVPMVVVLVDGLVKLIGPLSAVNQWTKDVSLGFFELIGVVDKVTPASENAATGVGRMATELDSSVDSVKRATEVTDLLKAAIEDELDVTVRVPAAIDALKDAIRKEQEAQKAAEQAAKDHTRELEEQIEATDELFSSKMALVGGDIAVRDSQRQATEAVAALNTLTAEGKTGSEEFAVAQDGAAESLLAAAQAAADYQIDQAEANGETLSGESKTNLYKLKLQELASTLAPGSPLRAQLDEYIAALAAIPSSIDTVVRVTRTGDLLTPIGGMRASGGPVSAGRSYLVGESGMELFTPAMNGYITPHNALAGGAGLGGGGVTLNMAVQTWDGTISPSTTARLVEAINRGIRTGGNQIVTA